MNTMVLNLVCTRNWVFETNVKFYLFIGIYFYTYYQDPTLQETGTYLITCIFFCGIGTNWSSGCVWSAFKINESSIYLQFNRYPAYTFERLETVPLEQ